MAKRYNYDAIMNKCNDNSEISRCIDSLQNHLKSLNNLTNECENELHGIGSTSSYYLLYKSIYNVIGEGSSGIWSTVINTSNTANKLYNCAQNDKAEWEEEERRRREEEERRRREEEERRRREEEALIQK